MVSHIIWTTLDLGERIGASGLGGGITDQILKLVISVLKKDETGRNDDGNDLDEEEIEEKVEEAAAVLTEELEAAVSENKLHKEVVGDDVFYSTRSLDLS